MKSIFAFIFAITVGFSASAQMNYSIDLTPTSEEYSEVMWRGYSTIVNLDDKVVKDLLKDKLKEYGKVKNEKKFWVVPQAEISSLSNADVVVYYDKEKKNQTKIWMSVYQNGVFQESLTENTMYSIIQSLYEKDLANKLEEVQDTQEDLAKDAKKIEKELKDDEGDIRKLEKKMNKSEKEVNKMRRELDKAEAKRSKSSMDLENVSVEDKEDVQEKNEDLMDEVAKLQKKIQSEEKDQVDYAKDIQKNREDIEKGKEELQEIEKKQKENKKILSDLQDSQKQLMRSRR